MSTKTPTTHRLSITSDDGHEWAHFEFTSVAATSKSRPVFRPGDLIEGKFTFDPTAAKRSISVKSVKLQVNYVTMVFLSFSSNSSTQVQGIYRSIGKSDARDGSTVISLEHVLTPPPPLSSGVGVAEGSSRWKKLIPIKFFNSHSRTMSSGSITDSTSEAFSETCSIRLPDTVTSHSEDHPESPPLIFPLPPSLMAEHLEMSLVYTLMLEVKISSRVFSSKIESYVATQL
jgi:hypothetical protein